MPNSQPNWIDPLPSQAGDVEGMYERAIPRMWPKGLRFPDTQIWLHREGVGAAKSAIAKTVWWIRDRYMPHRDTGTSPVFLSLWETLFALSAGGTTAERINRVIIAFRTRGTLTGSLMLAIFAPVFGVTSTEDLAFVRARPSDVTANGGDTTDPVHEQYYRINGGYVHIYSISGTLVPDEELGNEAAARIRRSGMTITFAADRNMQFGSGLTFFGKGTFA